MRVALVSYDFGEYCIRLASELQSTAECALLLPSQLAADHLSLLNSRVSFFPFNKPRLRQPLRQLRTIRDLFQEIAYFRPDVLHLQQGHFWFNLALPLLKRYPLVLTIHDPRHHLGDRGAANTPQPIFDFGFRQAAQIIVHTRQMADLVSNELNISPEIIHVIPHIRLGDETRQIDCTEDEQLILFFGRIWEYKGLEYLIRAEPLITAQLPEAKILIAGTGEDFERYRRMMVNPERFIVHNSYISPDEASALFRRASVVVLPYVEATQSGVVPQAFTFAKPVVATAVGGLPDQVDHGHTGLIVPPRNEHALAEQIIRLLRDRDLRRQLGMNGRRKVDHEWSAEAVAQKTLAVYQFVRQRSSASQTFVPKGL
jgi:glycosyltransferase involved in cell wall biosynthesis